MVLVIEGKKHDRGMITQSLETTCPSVRRRLASSVEEALATIRDSAMLGGVRLILLDAAVDGGSGLESLAALTRRSELTGIPVVVMAEDLASGDLTRAYELGARSVLNKPAKKDEFEAMLRAVCLYWLTVNLAVTDTRVRRSGTLRGPGAEQEA